MSKQFNNPLFNCNLNFDSNSQNVNIRSPIFGGATINIPQNPEESKNQILINNNFINIQQTIGTPNTSAQQQPKGNPQSYSGNFAPSQGQDSGGKFFFRKGYKMQGSQTRHVSPTPSTDDASRFKLSLSRPNASLERQMSVYTDHMLNGYLLFI